MTRRSQGRMIKKDIANSNKFASLTPEAAVLFAMLIPHFNSHGKMNGGCGYIKDEICPKIPYLSYENIPALMEEINEKTNVKWFQHDGRHWIHSLNFLTEHQELRADRMGADLLPEYSRSSPGVLPHEVKYKYKYKYKGNSRSTPGVEKSSVMQFIANYCEAFKNLYGRNPIITAKDSGIAKRLVELPNIQEIMEAFFRSKDKFIVQNCHSLSVVESQVNKLIGRIGKKSGAVAWAENNEKEGGE